ncbi:MAG TPA: 1-acyl-sn-glycerol-3-phosphate acyltransferase [Holophagaceae bacterium]|nr:1-acyl-sn-glycerol-3-phosphate acyltransferase [Holophagaceae bacterium]
MSQALLKSFARATGRLWFRTLRKEGPALPDGPVLVVLNHPNGLLDPLVVTALLSRPPRFVAKATLWKLLPLRPFLALFRPIPVQRTQDLPEGATEDQRQAAVQATFSAVHRAFQAGEVVGIYPEGISHGGHDLAPLKTGAARMALGAPERPVLVPAGLVYGDREIFRHNALLRLGAPIPHGDLPGSDPESVQILTARIREALRPLTLHGPEAERLRLAQDLAWLLAEGPETRADLEGLRTRVHALQDHLAALPRGEEARLREEVDRIQAWLQRHGLRPDQVGHAYGLPEAARWLPQALLRLACLLPCLPFGLLFWPAYRLVGWLAGRFAEEVDVTATVKLLAGLLLLPLWAAGLAWLGYRTLHLGSWAWLPLGCVAAWLSLPLTERVAEDLQAVRGFRARRHPKVPALLEAKAQLMGACPSLRSV